VDVGSEEVSEPEASDDGDNFSNETDTDELIELQQAIYIHNQKDSMCVLLELTKNMERMIFGLVELSVAEGGDAEVLPDVVAASDNTMKEILEKVLNKMRAKEIKDAAKLFAFKTKDHKLEIIKQLVDEILKVD
jgi:hypothetical protein